MNIVRHKKRTEGYATIANRTIIDPRLSGRSKWVLIYLLSKPGDWVPCVKDIASACRDGVHSVRVSLRDLCRCGYARRVRFRDHSGKFFWTWRVYESPSLNPAQRSASGGAAGSDIVEESGLFERPDRVFCVNKPVAENHCTGPPRVENRTLQKTEREKKEEQSAAAAPLIPFRQRRRKRFGAVIPPELHCVHRMLVGLGFESNDAANLILECGPRRVLIAVRNFEYYRLNGIAKGSGWLVKGFRRGYELLEGLKLVDNEDERIALAWEAANMTGNQIASVPAGMSERETSAERARQLAALNHACGEQRRAGDTEARR